MKFNARKVGRRGLENFSSWWGNNVGIWSRAPASVVQWSAWKTYS